MAGKDMTYSGEGGYVIQLSDTVEDPNGVFRALYVGVAGDISILWDDGSSCIMPNVPVGQWPWRVRRINVAGTAVLTGASLRGIK